VPVVVVKGSSFEIVGPGNAVAVCGIPLVRPVTVFFHPSGSNKSRDKASELATSVRDFLLDSSPHAKEGQPSCSHAVASIVKCKVCAPQQRTKMLVIVGDNEKVTVPNEAWWLKEDQNRKILPVYKSGAHPEKYLSPTLSILNAFFWEQSIAEATTAVLSAAQVTSDAHRLFISYRRLETQPLAEQLFSELNRHGFDVFLDRFSVPAAAQFQRRLHHELAEKSMVLLLESDRFGESKWTTEEIVYCKQYRLGLFSLRMPHGREPDPKDPTRKRATKKLPEVDDDIRQTLDAGDFAPGEFPKAVDGGQAGPPDLYLQWGLLTAAALQRVVEEIKRRHDEAQLRRLETMRREMLDALKVADAAKFGMRADGMMSVNGAAKRYAVWITTRPPELPDFHVTYSGSQDPKGTTGVIVGHRQLLEPDMQRRLVWLSGVCRLIWVDEGNIVSAAHDMAVGKL
jgi:hypothetical protein